MYCKPEGLYTPQ